jgi:hypothetical protein
MLVDLHLQRRLVAWGLALAILVPFLWCLNARAGHRPLSDVSGRVTYSGQPVNNMFICIDSEDGCHSALCTLKNDGTFQLFNYQYDQHGALPGRYHAHLLVSRGTHSPIPARYADSRTSGLEIDVASDWNYLDIQLQ